MKKVILGVFIVFLSTNSSYAQTSNQDCGFNPLDNEKKINKADVRRFLFLWKLPIATLAKIKNVKERVINSFVVDSLHPTLTSQTLMREVPIVAHIIRKSNGAEGLDLSILESALKIVNETFNEFYINFTLCSINFIDSDLIFNFTHGLGIELVNPASRNIPNKLNIYFLPNVRSNGTVRPNNNPNLQHITMENKSVALEPSHSKFITLRHEIGHWLNLMHTHEFTIDSPTHRRAELVDGSNCESDGDEICDTPADPGAETDNYENCIYIGTERDSNNQPYSPSTSNAMSYYGNCRNSFTPDQITRMHDAFINMEIDRGYTLEPCYNKKLVWEKIISPAVVDISFGDDEILYSLGIDQQVYKLTNGEWTLMLQINPSFNVIKGKKIASNNYRLVVINEDGNVDMYSSFGHKIPVPRLQKEAQDIAIDKNHIIYITDINGDVHKFENSRWISMGFENAIGIAVYEGRMMIIKEGYKIFEKNGDILRALPSIKAKDISMTNTKYCWVTGIDGQVYGWNGREWEFLGGSSNQRITSNDHEIFTINSSGKIEKFSY